MSDQQVEILDFLDEMLKNGHLEYSLYIWLYVSVSDLEVIDND